MILEELQSVIKITDVYGNEHIEDLDDEPSQEWKTKDAIRKFNMFYRRLDPDTRFYFLKWLRVQLIKELTWEEMASMTAKLTASSKGNAEPKNPNK